MNTTRTHTNNLISLLRRASIESTGTSTDFSAFVGTVTANYVASPEFSAVGLAAEAKLAVKATKAPKVYPLDADGNPIKPKRGRPVGSKNKPKVVETPVSASETPVIPAVYESVSAEA